jgi:hypothetical protein
LPLRQRRQPVARKDIVSLLCAPTASNRLFSYGSLEDRVTNQNGFAVVYGCLGRFENGQEVAMTSAVENLKLAELRAKTDRDLVRIISKGLERGLAYASAVTNRDCSAYVKAEKIHVEAVILLSVDYGLSEDRTAVEKKLDGLRLALDQVPPGNACRQAAGA